MTRFVLFLLFPALELYLLVTVGGMIGALNMVLWVFLSALIGIAAVRAQGQAAMFQVRSDLNAGKVPQEGFLEGLLRFFGGILLILPGLITDAIGLFLLLPIGRRLAVHSLAGYLSKHKPGTNGASRIIFFSNGPAGARMGGFDPDGRANQQGFPNSQRPFDTDPQGPRQATIIESTAIDVTNDNDSGPSDAEDTASRLKKD